VRQLFLPVLILAGSSHGTKRLADCQIFANQVDYIVDAPLGGNQNPSQIRDARHGVTGAVLRPS
jgi:tRNA A37 threonylcarbamoyladenosine synthetase subunit TsaC/SUA5/YrdC